LRTVSTAAVLLLPFEYLPYSMRYFRTIAFPEPISSFYARIQDVDRTALRCNPLDGSLFFGDSFSRLFPREDRFANDSDRPILPTVLCRTPAPGGPTDPAELCSTLIVYLFQTPSSHITISPNVKCFVTYSLTIR